jgi:hypothetical protein
MSLESWAAAGWLRPHQSSRQEIADLLAAAARDLSDAQVEAVSLDTRLALAYEAARLLARAALHASGHLVARRDQDHNFTIESLRFTVGLDENTVLHLQALRKKRNIGSYQRPGATSTGEVQQAIAVARNLMEGVGTWLRRQHPELL